jgi:hypothetical protein
VYSTSTRRYSGKCTACNAGAIVIRNAKGQVCMVAAPCALCIAITRG